MKPRHPHRHPQQPVRHRCRNPCGRHTSAHLQPLLHPSRHKERPPHTPRCGPQYRRTALDSHRHPRGLSHLAILLPRHHTGTRRRHTLHLHLAPPAHRIPPPHPPRHNFLKEKFVFYQKRIYFCGKWTRISSQRLKNTLPGSRS